MKVILRDQFQEDVSTFDAPAAPLLGDYFDVKHRYAHGHKSTRFKVVSRIFEVYSKRKNGPDSKVVAELSGCVCIVVPGA